MFCKSNNVVQKEIARKKGKLASVKKATKM